MSVTRKSLLLGLATLCAQACLGAPIDSSPACDSADTSPLEEKGAGESLMQFRSSHVSKTTGKAGKAAEALPAELHELGLQTFGSEEALDKVVAESDEISIKYAGVPIVLRVLAKDTAAQRFGGKDEDGEEYGLESLMDTRKGKQNMINMIDMGGNYGVVTVAVYNKFPDSIRAVVVEPIASTYFFLRWNMWLNEVPNLSKEDFVKSPGQPGVVALHRAVTKEEGQELKMCSHPEWSMNARVMTQQSIIDGGECDCNVLKCTHVPGITTQSLFDDFFGDAKINVLKMDCEGCEFESLPYLDKHSSRVVRLVGELHLPEENMIDIACKYDNGKYFTKVCRVAEWEWKSSLPLGCEGGRQACRWSR